MDDAFLNMTRGQRRSFYSQELFDDFSHLKKYLRFVIIFIAVCEVARSLILERQPDKNSLGAFKSWTIYVTNGLGCLLYLFSTLECIEKGVWKRIYFRTILLFSSNLGLSVGAYFRAYWEIKQAYEVNNIDTWLSVFTVLTTFVFGVVFADVIYPGWIAKCILPLATFSGLLTFIVNNGSQKLFTYTFRVISSGLYVIILYVVMDKLRWKIFEKRMKDETWDRIHKKILADIPTSIIIMDVQRGNINFVNEEFKRLSEGSSSEEFLGKIQNVKQRRRSSDIFFPLDGESNLSNQENSPDAAYRRTIGIDDPFTASPGYLNAYPRGLGHEFATLKDLAQEYCACFRDNRSRVPVIFDGSYTINKESKTSFEIKISCSEQYSKVIIMLNDTTQRDLIVTLKSNNQYKDRLIASISHELRTPLNGTLALLETVACNKNVSLYIKDNFLTPAWRSGLLLSFIVDDILVYSQIGSNSIKLDLKEQSIAKTIQDCFDLRKIQAHMKGLKFTMNIDTKIPQKFLTDHNKVKQVVLNLLGNAIRFTFSGEVKLEATMIHKSVLQISISDTGIGIPEEGVKGLFDRSSILNREKIDENMTGLNLGLTVANRLARMLGPPESQALKVDTELDRGSKFSFQVQCKSTPVVENEQSLSDLCFNLQLEEIELSVEEFPKNPGASARINTDRYTIRSNFRHSSSRRNTCPVSTENGDFRLLETNPPTMALDAAMMVASSGAGVSPKDILIVDDEPFNILAMKGLLKQFKCEFDVAYNGKLAIEKIQEKANPSLLNRIDKEGYKLIFMDFSMPVMDGYETTMLLMKEIKEGRLPDIIIVGCTAFDAKADIDRGKASGMVEVINKPVTREKLAPILRKYLNIKC